MGGQNQLNHPPHNCRTNPKQPGPPFFIAQFSAARAPGSPTRWELRPLPDDVEGTQLAARERRQTFEGFGNAVRVDLWLVVGYWLLVAGCWLLFDCCCCLIVVVVVVMISYSSISNLRSLHAVR